MKYSVAMEARDDAGVLAQVKHLRELSSHRGRVVLHPMFIRSPEHEWRTLCLPYPYVRHCPRAYFTTCVSTPEDPLQALSGAAHLSLQSV